MLAAAGGRLDRESGSECAAERGFALLERNSVAQADIDTVEVAPAPEDALRRVDVHDAEIAAEGRRHPTGLEDAADSELLASHHGLERDPTAGAEPVSLAEFTRDGQ